MFTKNLLSAINFESIKNTIVDFVMNDGWTLIKAILFLIIGLIVVKILAKLVKKILLKTKLDNIVCKFIASIVKVLLYVLLIMAVLQMVGVSITGIVAVISAAGVAVALALQDSLSNLANGIILIASHTFKEGDFVSVNGAEGKVEEINMLTTTIVTTDNKKITIPNSSVMNNPITNYSANETRRVNFDFGVAYESDTDKAKQIILDVIKSDGRVRLEKEPFVAIKTLGESSVNIFANCWCDNSDYWDVYYYVMDNVFNEFKRNNISIPFNQMEVRLRDDNPKTYVRKQPLQERVEKTREEKHESFINGMITKTIKKKKK